MITFKFSSEKASQAKANVRRLSGYLTLLICAVALLGTHGQSLHFRSGTILVLIPSGLAAVWIITGVRMYRLRRRSFEIDDEALRRCRGRRVATFLFDEVSKLSIHTRGDEAAALLSMKDGRHCFIDQCQAYTAETGESLVHALLGRLPQALSN